MESNPNWNPEFARAHYQGREIQVYGQRAAEFDAMTTHRKDYVQHPLEGRPQPSGQGYAGEPLTVNVNYAFLTHYSFYHGLTGCYCYSQTINSELPPIRWAEHVRR